MTEQEWLAATDTLPMLRRLECGSEARLTRRKAILFAAGCVRRTWKCLVDERSRISVETAERYADGLASDSELARAVGDAEAAMAARLPGRDARKNTCAYWSANAEFCAAGAASRFGPSDGPFDLALCPAHAAANAAASSFVAQSLAATPSRLRRVATATAQLSPAFRAEETVQTRLLREIFGNPFRPVAIDPAWREPTVVQLAQSGYEERQLPEGTLDQTRLAVLADALEETGCDNPEVLTHLRERGRHLRGCYVLDLLLGKK
jgi:hypothetical protein